MPEAHYVVSLAGESHETDRDDLTNSNVITVPVMKGPYRDAERAYDNSVLAYESSPEGYSVVTVHEENPDYVDVEGDSS